MKKQKGSMAEYLTVDDILEIHKDVTGRAGRWPTPLQDERGLARLLLKVRSAENEPETDIALQAALLAVGLAQIRPFEGSHLETAVGAMGAFLGFNGIRLRSGSVPEVGRLLRVFSEEHEYDTAVERFLPRLRALLTT
jgi:prophage maintenance system killer protein